MIPEDIIALILLMLPVEILLKFRSVCKSWNSLISSEKFVKTHLQMSTQNPKLINHTIILSSLFPSALVSTLHKYSPNQSVTYAFERYEPSIGARSNDTVHLMGSCNGLCCLLLIDKEGKMEFVLWNPATRRSSMKIQCVDNGNIWKTRFELLEFCGFGYDEAEGEYKVLLCRRTYLGERVVTLCGLKSKSRKRIDVHPFTGKDTGIANTCGTFVNGKLHWLISNVNSFNIVSFDLRTEMPGGVVDKPPVLDWTPFTPTLGVIDGCLYVISGKKQIRKDMWVLKEYGVKESWEKVLSPSYGKPLCVTPQGAIVFASEQYFYVHEPKMDTSPALTRKLSVYVQSLVSPVL